MMKITKINCSMITDPSLLWKLHRNTIQNKANIWMTKDNWNFKTKGNFVYIENDSKKEVLGTISESSLEIRGKCLLKYYSTKFCHVYS